MAVHVDQMGVDELNPELAQIQDIVTPFLPPNYSFLYALNATREIVNGIKYEIIFAMKNEHGVEIYCEMDVVEKPWLIRDSRKFRKMTYNNCSLNNSADEDDRMRFQYDVNPTFVNQRTEMTQDDLSAMEDMIIPSNPRPKTSTTTTTTETSTTTTTTESPENLTPLDPSSKNLLDDFFNMNNYFPPPQDPTTSTSTVEPLSNFNMDALNEMFGMKKIANSQAIPRSTDDDELSTTEENLQKKRVENNDAIHINNETALKELEADIKKVFSQLFQSDPEFQMNIIALINRKDDSTAQKNYNYVISILASRLKDKIETYNDKRTNENDDDSRQVTIDPLLNGEGDIRKKRSHGSKIRDLTEEALDTLDHIDADDEKRILIKILSVKEIDGKRNSIAIEATVANSKCQENSHEISECDEKIDQNSIKICLLEVK